MLEQHYDVYDVYGLAVSGHAATPAVKSGWTFRVLVGDVPSALHSLMIGLNASWPLVALVDLVK